MEQEPVKEAFATRLNALCDEMGVPPKGKNRQTSVAKIFEVSQKGARKWLEGEGLPTLEMCVRIALWGRVSFEWLMTGRGEMRIQSASLAVNEPMVPYAIATEDDVMRAWQHADPVGRIALSGLARIILDRAEKPSTTIAEGIRRTAYERPMPTGEMPTVSTGIAPENRKSDTA